VILVLKGQIELKNGEKVHQTELAVFNHDGEKIEFQATEDSIILFLSGEPIKEPVVGLGPFVMNTKEEIEQAFSDYHSGKMAGLS
jgi:redox-sensitive bicupin YhaK (pirin superfamily)